MRSKGAIRFLPGSAVPMVDEPLPRQSTDPADVAAYVASLATDLAILTHKAGLTSLEYLLEMLRLEAENLNRPPTED